MSKDLIVRLREAAAQRVASTAMIGADDLIAAADALEQTEAARMAAISRLCEAEVACAVACQERDALAAELKGVRVTQQAPTTDDINLQNWKGMDGACAWHLIDRHAEDWSHVARLMNAWLEANRQDLVAELKALREQELVGYIHPRTYRWFAAHKASPSSYAETRIYCSETDSHTVPLYAHPAPARELTDAIDDLAQHIRQIDGNHSMGAGALAESIAEWADRYLKGEEE